MREEGREESFYDPLANPSLEVKKKGLKGPEVSYVYRGEKGEKLFVRCWTIGTEEEKGGGGCR